MISLIPIKKAFDINGLYSAFRFDWDSSFVFSGESHNFWEAVFVVSGKVEVTEDENIYTLGEGNIIFHAPMEFHRIKSSSGSSPSGFILSFSASGVIPEMLCDGVFSLDPTQISEYEEICKKALEFKNLPSDSLLGQELSERLSLFMIKLSTKNTSMGVSMTLSAIEYRRIVSYMSEQVTQNLTLTDIANANNVSVSYLKLLFKTYAGISPKNYFNQLRVRRATELLEKGISVSCVSDIMNFSSPSYFSVYYKKNTGSSPSNTQK